MNFPLLPMCWPAKEILSISYALTGFWKLYGDTDSGQRLLPSLSGSTNIIVLGSLPGWAGLCSPRPFAGWCDNTRLREELVEVSIGSFVQVHIRATCSDLVRNWPSSCLTTFNSYIASPRCTSPGWPGSNESFHPAEGFMLLGGNLWLYLNLWELAAGVEGRRPTSLPWPEPGHYDLSQS